MHQGLEFGEACEKWNFNTVLEIFVKAFPLRNSGQQTPQRRLGGTSQLSIAAEITNSFIQEVGAAAPVEPYGVVAATHKYRSFLENLQIPPSTCRLMERWGMGNTGNWDIGWDISFRHFSWHFELMIFCGIRKQKPQIAALQWHAAIAKEMNCQ